MKKKLISNSSFDKTKNEIDSICTDVINKVKIFNVEVYRKSKTMYLLGNILIYTSIDKYYLRVIKVSIIKTSIL